MFAQISSLQLISYKISYKVSISFLHFKKHVYILETDLFVTFFDEHFYLNSYIWL